MAASADALARAQLRLVTIPISHYCEKARWALERGGIRYREERHVQGVHVQAALRAGGGRTVPVLVTPAGSIGESGEILEWVDTQVDRELRLFPAEREERERVAALCARFDTQLGPSSRRLIYVRMMAQRDLVIAFNNQGVPRWEDLAIRSALPVFLKGLSVLLGIRPGVEVGDEAQVWQRFDEVGELLCDGRSFLCGERFSAADLTFAALAAPVLMPSSYGVALPQPEQLDEPTARLVRHAREHPAGRFAMEMFATQRSAPAGVR